MSDGGNVCIAEAAPAPRTSNDRLRMELGSPSLTFLHMRFKLGIAVLGGLPVPRQNADPL
jgi:hypothetical protein